MKSFTLIALLLVGCGKALTFEEAQEHEKYCESRGMRVEYTRYVTSKEVHSIACIDTIGNKYFPKVPKG